MQHLGQEYENHAAAFLRGAGLKICQHNYRCRMGEIDIIARDGKTLIFIEVKYRSSAAFGGAIAAITAAKIRKLKLAAEHYLSQHKITDNCRFDVVAISRTGQDSLSFNWIKNAF